MLHSMISGKTGVKPRPTAHPCRRGKAEVRRKTKGKNNAGRDRMPAKAPRIAYKGRMSWQPRWPLRFREACTAFLRFQAACWRDWPVRLLVVASPRWTTEPDQPLPTPIGSRTPASRPLSRLTPLKDGAGSARDAFFVPFVLGMIGVTGACTIGGWSNSI